MNNFTAILACVAACFFMCCSFVFRKVRDVAAERINRGQTNYGWGGGGGGEEDNRKTNVVLSTSSFFSPPPPLFSHRFGLFFCETRTKNKPK